jgi:predicted deacetylase
MTSAVATQFMPVVAGANATKEFVVISIHDVAPSSQAVCDEIISALGSKGVRHCSLLVVPDYHHQGASMKDRQFVSWLRGLEADGHEIVIHGFFHERPARGRENVFEKFVTRFYTEGEGEFYDLSYSEALRRIESARDAFRAAGLKPHGFVAPAWLLSSEGERAARDANMEYTTRLRSVRDLRSGERFPARSLVYSVRNGWRRAVSLGWNRTLHQIQRGKPLVRLSIHPPDFSHPAIWRQILELTGELAGTRSPITYESWIAAQRRIAI